VASEEDTVSTSATGWVNIVYKLGLPVVLTIFLVYALIGDIKSGLLRIETGQVAMALEMQKTSTTNVDVLVRLDRIQRVLTAMCVNAAGNDQIARASCVQ
jgi:hypothetical protein